MGALTGLKILDFSSLMPGPIATTMLADLGAEIVSVSAPGRPDLMNSYPPVISDLEMSASAAYLGRNKRSITLNLKNPASIEAVKKMVCEYDIVIEQFRPGVMQRMGLGYEDLKAVNPAIIYCSITGYGQTGPMADRPGHDINYLAVSGNALYRAADGTERAVAPNFQLADVAGGSYMSMISILAAVYYREQTGKGQYIDVSMTDSIVPFCFLEGCGALAAERYEDSAWENRHVSGVAMGAAYGFFETADHKYLSIGALEPKFFIALCEGVGHPEWVEQRFALKEPERFSEELSAIIRTKTRDEWSEVFSKLDTCVEPVLGFDEITEYPQFTERKLFPEVPLSCDPAITIRQIGTPVHLSETPAEYRHTAFPAGYHNEEVLSAFGFSKEAIQSMQK